MYIFSAGLDSSKTRAPLGKVWISFLYENETSSDTGIILKNSNSLRNFRSISSYFLKTSRKTMLYPFLVIERIWQSY
jgi:hypothetical protein